MLYEIIIFQSPHFLYSIPDNRYYDGCLFVMYSPAGAGKTSYLLKSANDLRQNQIPVLYLEAEMDVHSALGINPQEQLKNWVPHNALIIIDQAEKLDLDSPRVQAYLRALATHSRNTRGKFNVLVAVSNVQHAKTILWLNGLDKITALARSPFFKWTRNEVERFLQNSPTARAVNGAQALAEKAAAPLFLERLHRSEVSTDWEREADICHKEWDSYLEVDACAGITLEDEHRATISKKLKQ